MTIEVLYDAFEHAARDRSINGRILPLMGRLTEALGVKELVLRHGEASRQASFAKLVGTVNWPEHPLHLELEKWGWSLTLIGTVNERAQDVLTLTLQARTPQGVVSLGTLVPDLPDSSQPDPDTDGGIKRGKSILAEIQVQQSEINVVAVDNSDTEIPTVALSGRLDMDYQALHGLLGVIGASYPNVVGTINPRTDAATETKINLRASAPLDSFFWAETLNLHALFVLLTTDYHDHFGRIDEGTFSSAALLVLQIQVRTPELHTIEVTVPPLISSHILDVNGAVDPPLTLADGLVGLNGLFPHDVADIFALPATFPPLNVFGLSHLRMGIITEETEIGPFTTKVPTGLAYTAVTLHASSDWDLPLPLPSLQDVGASWLVRWDGSVVSYWSGNLFGTMRFELNDGGTVKSIENDKIKAAVDDLKDVILINVNVSLPDLNMTAKSHHPFSWDLTAAMTTFFPGSKPVVGSGLVVDFFSLTGNVFTKTMVAECRVHGAWKISAGNIAFQLVDMSFSVTLDQSSLWGGLQGMVEVLAPPPSPPPGGEDDDKTPPALETLTVLSMGAYYPGDGGWTFRGGLAGAPLSLTGLVNAFLGEAAPSWLQNDPTLDVTISKLWAEYATSPGNPYSVSGALDALWQPTVFDITLGMAAEADIVYRQRVRDSGVVTGHDALLPSETSGDGDGPDMAYEATVKGVFTVNNLIITAGVSLRDQEQTWLFRVQLDRFLLEGTSAYTGVGKDRHQVIRVLMHGVSFGTMVASFAALANPNANYQLPAPWDFLDHIHMGSFTLIVDPSLQTVRFDYVTKIHLGFLTVESVGVNYDRSSGEPRVFIEITGAFLGKKYGGDPANEPLSWDALNDSPPEVPGEGDLLVDLRYLGLGQHLALTGLTKPDSVADVLALMQQQMKPALDSRNPLDQPGGENVSFDEGSQWLIGADLTVLDTATVQLVMHDPDLYGVLIALSGKRAGVLAGFSFELLYKKVSDDVGVFHGRLQVPTAFRHLNLGAVALTLGVIAVDMYTNGDFKIDLGFPHNRDFKNSFGLTYGAFTGVGGVYFGKLSGATSSKVPAIRNGNFSPVLELGVGLAVRAGRAIKEGPLEASLYVQLEVIFEGVLAWFNPDDAGNSDALYYRAQGMAKLVGKLCGKVNFKVIAVEISLDAVASVTLAMEAYRRTLIEMFIDVQAHAKVKVGFVKVSFSFKVRLDVSFVIGSDSTTPWTLGGSQTDSSGGRGQLEPSPSYGEIRPLPNASRRVRAPRRRSRFDLARRLQAQVQGRLAFPAEGEPAYDPSNPNAGYCLDFSASAKVFPDGAVQALDVRLLPAYTVAEAMLVWPDQSLPHVSPTTSDQMVFLLTIDGPTPIGGVGLEAARTGPFQSTARAETQAETPFAVLADALFRWALTAVGLDLKSDDLNAGQLETLADQLDDPKTFANGFSFDNLSGFLGNNVELRISGQPVGETPDDMSGVSFPMPPVLKWVTTEPKGTGSERNFADYRPVNNAYAASLDGAFAKISPGAPVGEGSFGGISDGESLSSVVFREYLLLVTKSMVQAARNLFASFPVDLHDDDTLTQIAAAFPTVTLNYIKHRGDTPAQVAAHFGVDEASLLQLNPDLGQTLTESQVGGTVPVLLGETPESLAAANPNQALQVPKRFDHLVLQTQVRVDDTPDALCRRLGAELNNWTRHPEALDAPITRAGASLDVPDYTFANPTILTRDQVAALFYVRYHDGAEAVLQAPRVNWFAEAITALNGDRIGADGALPETILLPGGYNQLDGPTVSWKRLVGDTLGNLAAMTALSEYPDADPTFSVWRKGVHKLDYATYLIPATTVTLQPDETLRALATRTLHVKTEWMTNPEKDALPNRDFNQMIAHVSLLKPLAPVVVTGCSVHTLAGDSVRSFATRYDLPLESVGRLGADEPGWFVPGETPLSVTHVAAVSLNQLSPKLLADTPVRDVAGQVSRFMLHGQRLPVPGDETKRAGLYELIGQQVAAPTASGVGAHEPALTLAVTAASPVPWVTLVGSETVAAGAGPKAQRAVFRQRVPDFARHNPAADRKGLRAGMVVDTGVQPDQTLTLVITNQMLIDNEPSDYLKPDVSQDPAPMPLSRSMPVRHGLVRGMLWNTPQRPLHGVDDTPVLGMPSLWPLPRALAPVTAADDAKPWQVYAADPGLGPDAPATALERTTWATHIDIRINRVPGSPHIADVVGADPYDRHILLKLWQYLDSHRKDDGATLWLGFRRSAAAGLATGLSSPEIDRNQTYLVRTNLSTETHAGSGPDQVFVGTEDHGDGDTPLSSAFFAPLADPCTFLTLLWEASVVGGGGYWWHLTDTDGNGFPPDVFGDEGGGTVTLIAVLDSQSGKTPQRRLHPFTTAASVGVPVDESNTALFVAAPDGRETVTMATMDPGRVGFTMGIRFPWDAAFDKDTETRRLYNVAGYQLRDSDAFSASDPGRPVGPEADNEDDENQTLSQVIPIYRYAKASQVPKGKGLPPAEQDPYAGISRPGAQQPARAKVNLFFQDVFGNRTAEDGDGGDKP